MNKLYLMDPDVAASGWLEWPEECLWIKHPTHTSILPRPALEGLYSGQRHPSTPTEEILAAHPEWLRILIDYALGEYIVTISANRPLPEWSSSWLQSVRP